ncbi:WxL domain-containing protein [Lactococcus kimchii]|uniref:WxL domain-containing protein n=1 Tax=Lactococcus sp. S-13 TaxID=2507158 RepID=UPI001023BCA0|nr:WxL domain-containing protein [Lactococcus sp. S-13]RZI49397.1 WxL domain-containing protein [Lactococcus sp. S-13]
MKSPLLKSSALLTALLIAGTGVAQVASAATSVDYSSDAQVTLTPGDGTNPVDPTDPTKPVVPENPDPSVPTNPGTGGSLSIDFASSLAFGTQKISGQAQTFYAHAQALSDGTTRPDYVQVSDLRGTAAGWTLTVTEDAAGFVGASGEALTGATLGYTGAYTAGLTTAPSFVQASGELTPGQAQKVMAANANEGTGTWVLGAGAGVSGTDNSTLAANNAAYQENGGAKLDLTAVSTKSPITLKVPAGVGAVDTYKTNLTWTLNDTPAN